MTPTAVTPAARSKRVTAAAATKYGAGTTAATKSGASTAARATSPHPSAPRPAHRSPAGRATAPRSPRRVSGPVARSAAAPARPTAPVRAPERTTSRRSSAPRRGGVAQTPGTARTPRGSRRASSLPARARLLARLRTLPDHALLDRVVRGRLWIPLLGVLLAGIVATQVEVLKLNASIGHSVIDASALTGENQVLRTEISQLSDEQRIEVAAEKLGMQMPETTQNLFLPGANGATLTRALRNIHAPNPTSFAAQTAQTASARQSLVQYSSGQ